jgi:peroxiredoxin
MKAGWLRNVLVLGVTTVAILGGVWLVKGQPTAASPTAAQSSAGVTAVDVDASGPAPKIGEAAPAFTGVTADGEELSTSSMKGKPIWLVFGATWCANCRAEAPDVGTVATAYSGRVTVVSIYVGESTSTVQDYVGRLGLDYPQVPDPNSRIAAAYGVVGVPAHYFIDSTGVVRNIKVGVISPSEATADIDAMLG